ncbi:MAG: hypothetical protein J6X11_10495 [Treponema sp.]|nr:hypothetical protein [Treponema sp.]MBP5748384.1 hypothetical protein [Treponema sp.]
MKRPPFCEIKSFSEFSKYYWYREELQQICKQIGIDSSGMKVELNRNIEEYFKGNLICPKSKRPGKSSARRTQVAGDDVPLALDTPLLACGFRFSQRFRDFFSAQTGLARFKFNADMVATAKKVRETGDASFTLGDLLNIFYGKKTYAKYDNSCLQWNKFVKDFCADPATAQFSDKLKTAAILWRQVRNSTLPKVYDTKLLKEMVSLIE